MLYNCIWRERGTQHAALKLYDQLYHVAKYKLPREKTAFIYLQRMSQFIRSFIFA